MIHEPSSEAPKKIDALIAAFCALDTDARCSITDEQLDRIKSELVCMIACRNVAAAKRGEDATLYGYSLFDKHATHNDN